MPLAEDFYSSLSSTLVTVDGQENTKNLLNGPESKKSRSSFVQNLELVPHSSSQHQQSQQHTTHRRYSDNSHLRHRVRRFGTQCTAVVNSFTMQGYRAQQSFVVDFEQTPAPAQTQTYAPYALPVCYAPVCCAPHMPVNRWGTFPNTTPTPCSCAPGLQVLTSCDSVACTAAASHAGTLSVPFIHYHGIPVPYHCPHFHPHRLPPPSQTPSVIPVSFASSVYPTPAFQPGAVSTVYHQQQQPQQQQQPHRGYHSNHQQQQQPTSFHGHPVPAASASQQQPNAYHSHQVATAQPPTAYHSSHMAQQQPSSYHNSQVTAQQPSANYHSHQITSQPSVYLHQSPGHLIPAPGQSAHQVNDEMAGADTTLQTSLIHPAHQQSVAAAAITGQPLQHAASTAVPPPWLLPLPHSDLLAAQVPQYRSVSSGRQRWRTYPPVAAPYSGYLLHFLAMLGRPTVVSATLPHHRVSLQNDDFTDLDSYEALLSLAERLGEVKSRGLSKPDIEKLQCYRFESVVSANSDRTSVGDESSTAAAATAASATRLDQTSCVVCLCDFEPRQMVRILPCRHEFHARCVDRWLKTNRTCPLCRADVTETTKMDVE